MKQETSNIDKLFREKLQDYQSNPMPNSWKNISEKLSSEERGLTLKKKRILYSSIAASVILFSMIALFVFPEKSGKQTEQTAQPGPVISVKKEIKDTVIASAEEKKKTIPSSPQKTTATSIALIYVEEKTADHKKEVSLPDGSKIVLNRNSSIKYPQAFTAGRIVYLSGEAFFDIKPDAQHPFVVYGNFSKTEVVGTSFIVRSFDKEQYDEINVTSGKVSFGETVEKGDKIAILAGNKGILLGGKLEQSVIHDLNYNAWLTDKIIFHDTKLKEVFEVLEKQYNVSVSVKNPKILNCQFTGVFEKSDIDEILQVLSVSFSLSFNQERKHYILSGKGCR